MQRMLPCFIPELIQVDRYLTRDLNHISFFQFIKVLTQSGTVQMSRLLYCLLIK